MQTPCHWVTKKQESQGIQSIPIDTQAILNYQKEAEESYNDFDAKYKKPCGSYY